METKRCAIYTRKSCEDGLELDYNSLDAQRDAGENYIASQKANGWICLPEHYDDGGFSGGDTHRPALARLLDDIKEGKIDIILVYKIDRLSRSIGDFTKLLQVFDDYNVSFVSVTQEINTSTSSGRMMLNVLISFAQYEREIIGERIRDKVAGTRKRGILTGGMPHLGYDLIDKRMVINPEEAKTVQLIFRLYCKYRSARLTCIELNKRGLTTKCWITKNGNRRGGKRWDMESLCRILKTPIYIGKVPWHDQLFDGIHQPIIAEEIFNETQQILRKQTAERKDYEPYSIDTYPLAGLIYCGYCHDLMLPTYVDKPNQRYHYYYCKKKKRIPGHDCPLRMFPAGNLEEILLTQLGRVFRTPSVANEVTRQLRGSYPDIKQQEILDTLGNINALWNALSPLEKRGILRLLIRKIEVFTDCMRFFLNPLDLRQMVVEIAQQRTFKRRVGNEPEPESDSEPAVPEFQPDGSILVSVPIIVRRKPLRTIIVPEEDRALLPLQIPVVRAIAQGRVWAQAMREGSIRDVTAIMEMTGWDRCRVIRILGLSTLSTELVVAYCTGVEPDGLGLGKLSQQIPTSWTKQHEKFYKTPGIVNDAVERELASLALAFRPELVARWQDLFKRNPPDELHVSFMRRQIAQRLQENAFGRVPEHLEELLWRAYTQGMKKPDRHGLYIGSQLIREWKREKFVVTVRPKGYEVRGRVFKSLSGAAKFITGTNWNGTKFFGVTSQTVIGN